MDVREKLVELLSKYFDIGDSYCYNLTRTKNAFACGTMGFDDFEEFDDETVADIADHLIAHGVTVQDNTEITDELLKQLRNAPLTVLHEEPTIEVVQEWISVKEHLPQENEPEGTTCEQVQVLLDNGVVSTGWCNRHTKLWWHLNYGETHFVGYDYEHTPVIAWQPLAQPPKGE